MSDKKQIDRLFQEKLKDFEVMPKDHVWNNINKQLQNKKDDRKVIPIWWKFAGVAAILLVLFTVGNFMFNSENESVNPVLVDTKKDEIKETDNKNTTDNIDLKEVKEDLKNINSTESKANIEAISNKLNNQTVQQEVKTKINSLNKETENNFQSNKVSTNSENATLNASVKYANNLNKDNSLNKNSSNLPEQSNLNKSNAQEALKNNSVNTIITNTENKPQETINNAIANEEVKEIMEKEKLKEGQKLPLTEEVLASTEEIIEEEKELSRWQVSPNIAPVYFNSLGSGSSIDPLFENNSKSGNVNFSYGINTTYAINDRLSVRTGINKVNLSYDTNDVIAFQSLNANNGLLRNINISNNAENVSLMSASNVSLAQSPEGLASTLKASLSQEIGFVEVPLELKYSVVNKKLGVNLIGGASVLFLNNNEIYTVINEVKTPLGEANNINNTSYSANVGLGFDYKASKNVSLNLEPMFKYQINTFNNTSGDFKPYFIGVYTGINVKF